MDLPELKNCPFCGAEAEHRDDGDFATMEGIAKYWVQCTKCMAGMEGFWSPEAAAEDWNKRVSD